MKTKYLVYFLILIASKGFAANDLSAKLIELRSQVQSEADQLETEKKTLNASIQSLTVEKGELESRKKLLSLQNRQMKDSLLEKSKIIGGAETEELKGYSTLVDAGLVRLNAYLDSAVPFKKDKRKQSLEKLKTKFQAKEITLAEYFEKYWSVLQSEIRLSENVEIQSDSIKIRDKEYQVKILKLGMAQMYFKTLDGRIGYAHQSEGAWKTKFFEKSSDSKGVSLLFEAKEKQVKGGNYELPIFVGQSVSQKGGVDAL